MILKQLLILSTLFLATSPFNLFAADENPNDLFLKAKEAINRNSGDSYTASKEGLENSIKEMKHVLESGYKNETEALVLLRDAYNDLAIIYFRAGSDERIRYTNEKRIINARLIELQPDNVDILYEYTITEKDLDLKLKTYREIIEIDPDHGRARFALGRKLIDKGIVKEGVRELKETLRRSKGRNYKFFRKRILSNLKQKGLIKERDEIEKEFNLSNSICEEGKVNRLIEELNNITQVPLTEGSGERSGELIIELGKCKSPKSIPAMLNILGVASGSIVLEAFAKMGPSIIKPLIAKSKDEDKYIRAKAIYYLWKLPEQFEHFGHKVSTRDLSAMDRAIVQATRDTDKMVREKAYEILREMSE